MGTLVLVRLYDTVNGAQPQIILELSLQIGIGEGNHIYKGVALVGVELTDRRHYLMYRRVLELFTRLE